MIEQEWADKYDPKTIDDMVLTDSLRTKLKNIISSGQMTGLTLAGINGIGKTTLAKIIAREFNAIVYFNKCGKDKSVDVVTGPITQFCDSETIDDRMKIVLLDEADQLSGGDRESSAQKSLRGLVEDSQSDTRFILTCNYPNQILAPIKSRCPVMSVKYAGKDVMVRIRHILDTEGIKYDKGSLKVFVEDVVKPCFPDIRQMIHRLQMCCTSGELVVDDLKESVSDIETFVNELVDATNSDKPINDVRKMVIKGTGIFENNYVKLASMIFNKIARTTTNVKLLKVLTHYLYKVEQVSDPEIQIFGMLLEIRG